LAAIGTDDGSSRTVWKNRGSLGGSKSIDEGGMTGVEVRAFQAFDRLMRRRS
jgi:hypothetical protein